MDGNVPGQRGQERRSQERRISAANRTPTDGVQKSAGAPERICRNEEEQLLF